MNRRPYPISAELRVSGLRWREEFTNQEMSRDNGGYFTGDPVISNGIVLDGSTQWADYVINPGVFDQYSFFLRIGFIPGFVIDPPPGGSDPPTPQTLLDTQATGRVLVYIHTNGNLYVQLDGTTIATITWANYTGYWNSNDRNVLVVSAITGNNKVWLNGNRLTNSSTDTVAWTRGSTCSSLTVGATYTHNNPFVGTIYSIWCGHRILEDDDGVLFSIVNGEEAIIGQLSADASVITLSCQDRYYDAGSKMITPLLGQLSGLAQQPVLGLDGTDTANFPALLMPRGLSFDGSNDRMVVFDNDSLSFGDGAGTDQPFTMCAVISVHETANWLISRKGASGDSEYRVVGSNCVVSSYFYGPTASDYVGRSTNMSCSLHSITGRVPVVSIYDGNKVVGGIRIYINGMREDANDLTGGTYTGMVPGVADLLLGGRPPYLEGDIFVFSIYSREFTEIQAELWSYRANRLLRNGG